MTNTKCTLVVRMSMELHHLANMQLGQMLTRFGLTLLEVSLKVSPGFV